MDRRNLLALFALALFLIPSLASAQSSTRDQEEQEEEEDLLKIARRGKKNPLQLYYRSQTKAKPSEVEAYKIGAVEWDLPYGKVRLDGGWVVPVAPAEVEEKDLAGQEVPERKYIAAVYVGNGSFHWDPPNDTEKWMLNNGLKELGNKKANFESLDSTIKDGAVLYLNGRWRQLLEEAGEKGAIDKKSLKAAQRMFTARKGLWRSSWAREQVVDAFGGEERGFLGLDMKSDNHKGAAWFLYQLDPKMHEAASVGVAKTYALNKDIVNYWDLGSWVLPEVDEELDDIDIAVKGVTGDVDIEHYDLDLTVYRDQDEGRFGLNVKGTTRLKVLAEKLEVVRLGLMSTFAETDGKYRVKSLKDKDGNPLEYLHEGGTLIFRPSKPYTQGEVVEFALEAEGLVVNSIKQPPPQTSLSDQSSWTADTRAMVNLVNYRLPVGYDWFPSTEHGYFTFDWILRLPKPFVAATSGTLLTMQDDGKHNVHTIREQTPVKFPAILFGRFAVTENDPDYEKGEKKIRIYAHPGQDKDAKSFIEEAHGIIQYYEALFGPYPYQELDLAQMPVGMGYAQAPAGLVQMTGETYISKTDLVNIFAYSDPQLRDYFIPHEIAHEWFGAKTGFTVRDQWISETFAEFAASLYVEFRDQQESGDADDISGYEDRKYEWKSRRRGHKQSRTAPLWVGYRAGSAKTQSSIYARGPLLMDVLRKNFGREAVVKAMNFLVNYAWDHRGGFAFTEDWQKLLESAIPGVGFAEFVEKYIKGNEPVDGFGSKDEAAAK